jgi:hypothetical protein
MTKIRYGFLTKSTGTDLNLTLLCPYRAVEIFSFSFATNLKPLRGNHISLHQTSMYVTCLSFNANLAAIQHYTLTIQRNFIN